MLRASFACLTKAPGKMMNGRMSPKMAPRGFYKGVGARPMGRHTRLGRYVVDPMLVPQYDIPSLVGFELKPYVARNTPLVRVPPPTRILDFVAKLHQPPPS